MAPVEADVFSSNREPLFHIVASAGFVSLCLVTVLRYISTTFRTLPPAQKTRAREEKRKKELTTFAALATASLLVSIYHWGYALLSTYEAWAHEQGEPTPGALWDGWYAGEDDLDWQLGRWWQEVNPQNEFKRAALGSSKAVWWTQQLLISRLAFSTFMGIEGRRRDIPSWTITALWGVAEFFSLSLAQCLFFVILIITPLPTTKTQHGARWAPNVSLYLLPVVAASASVWYLPGLTSNEVGWTAETGSRLTALFLAAGIRFLPKTLGKQYNDAHAARRAESSVYSALSLVSTAFFLRSTFWGAMLNAGETYHRQYNFVWSTHPYHERSMWSKFYSASVTILGAISNDPVVSVIGWDVLLSGFSLCIWAADRGLDVKNMLSSITPTFKRESAEKHVAFDAQTEPTIKEETSASPESRSSPSGRRRGRPRKNEPPSPTPRRSLRRRGPTHESDTDDAAYVPPPKTAGELADVEHEGEHDDTVAEDAEAAALAWGLSLVGGLGLMSAAVMGAEVRSR